MGLTAWVHPHLRRTATKQAQSASCGDSLVNALNPPLDPRPGAMASDFKALGQKAGVEIDEAQSRRPTRRRDAAAMWRVRTCSNSHTAQTMQGPRQAMIRSSRTVWSKFAISVMPSLKQRTCHEFPIWLASGARPTREMQVGGRSVGIPAALDAGKGRYGGSACGALGAQDLANEFIALLLFGELGREAVVELANDTSSAGRGPRTAGGVPTVGSRSAETQRRWWRRR